MCGKRAGTGEELQRGKGGAGGKASAMPTEKAGSLMYQIIINTEQCDGCEECVNICPSNVLVLVDGKCTVQNVDDCAGCMSCVEVCPNQLITVNEI